MSLLVHRVAPVLCVVALLAGVSTQARGACGDNVGDQQAVDATRAGAEAQCSCATASNHGQYVRCVAGVAKTAVANHTLPPNCQGRVVRCASRSTCGRSGFVTCCRTNVRGLTTCSVKRTSAQCRAPSGGSACVGSFASCCDACTASGCATGGSTTTTMPGGGTTTSTHLGGTTTTSSSIPGATTSTSTSTTSSTGPTTTSSSVTSTTGTTLILCTNLLSGTGMCTFGGCPPGQHCIDQAIGTTCGCVAGSTTSTSTSTSLPGATTTTTSIPPVCCGTPTPTKLTFTTSLASGNCGTANTANGSVFTNLACGGLYFGGGQNAVPLPAVIPDQGRSIIKVASCSNDSTLTLAAATQGGPEGATDRTCTAVGCKFGPPLPIPNPSSPPTSTCVINSVSTNASGIADCHTGSQTLNLPLNSEIFLTGDLFQTAPGIQPCPVCNQTCNAGTNLNGPCNADADCPSGGTGSCAGAVKCHGGLNDGNSCVPGDSAALGPAYPTSHDCPPSTGLDIGGIPIGFLLTTGTVSYTAVPSPQDTAEQRVFCGFCRDAANTGNFENPALKCIENGVQLASCPSNFATCEQKDQGAFGPGGNGVKTITEVGFPSGDLTDHATHPQTLVSIFCIPPTFNATVDGTADLPGPGSVALEGTTQMQ